MSSENFNIGQGTAPNWDGFNVSDSNPTNQTQATGFSTQTTISTSEGNQTNTTKLYLNPSFKPTLMPSTNDNPAIADATLGQLFDFDTLLQGILQLNGTPPAGSPGDEFLKELAKMPVDDPEIIALAQKLGVPPGQVLYNVQIIGQKLFNEALKDLPKDVADKLLFAHNNPEAAKNLSPELKAQLAAIEAGITQSLKTEFGFTQEWKGISPDNTDFNQKVMAQFDSQFEEGLNALVDSGKLTEKQALQVRSLHYQVADKATADPALVKVLTDLETSAAASLRSQYGADASWQPQADVTYHTAVLNGRFQAAFQEALNNFQPPLSADTKAQVIKSFANPTDPSIPENIKSLTKTIQAAATQVVISEFGLSPTWQTTATTAVSLNPNAGMANAAIATLKEVHAAGTQLVQQMPDSPDKVNYMNFLKAIGDAISRLQELLYAIQSSDSIQSKKLSNAKMDTAMNQIAIQQKKADEVKEKMQKMAALGPLKALFEWLIKLIMLVIAFSLGPVMLAIVITYLVDSTKAEMTETTSLFQKMFNGISDKAGKGPAIAINMILTFGISMGNPLLLMQMFTQDSRCVQNFVAVCGGDKSAQEMTAAIFGMIMQMAILFPLVLLSGGSAAPAEVAYSVANAMRISLDQATQLTKAASIAFQAIMASLEVSKGAMQINNHVLQAQIEIIKATADAYSEEAQALVQTLKKLIQKLLDLMNGRADQILDLSNFQAKKYNDASRIMTELFS